MRIAAVEISPEGVERLFGLQIVVDLNVEVDNCRFNECSQGVAKFIVDFVVVIACTEGQNKDHIHLWHLAD
jgi:hypothetical protein